MKSNVFPVLVVFATAFGFAACGGSTAGSPAAPSPDAGDTTADGGAVVIDAAPEADPPPLDHGKPTTTYPAFKVDGAQLVDNSGDRLKTPTIVTVTWDTDPDQAKLEAFGDAIGGTDYWKAVTAEYGVAPAISGMTNHVRIPVTASSPLPVSLGQMDLDTLVATKAGTSMTSGWPAPTSNHVYIVYLHPNTILDFGGGASACTVGVGGYHDSTMVNGADISYAIVPRCSFHMLTAFDATTITASHELAEAATDPRPGNGIYGFDDNHFALEQWQRGNVEDGDACEFFKDSEYKETDPFPYFVQRQWSNVASAAGHDPCVPSVGPYFNVTPLSLETVYADLSKNGGSAKAASKGIPIKVGETKTFPVGFFSDAPTNGPWTVRAVEQGNPAYPVKTPHLKVSIDKTSGENGEIAYVTVTVNSAGATKTEYISVVSTLNGITRYMPILIGSM